LATLRNILPMSMKIRKEMVALGMDATLLSRRRDHWHDPDITENLTVLAEAIDAESASMSTFDVYRHEVLSGALDWTPAHRDENFWRVNVEKHEDDNLEVLRCLVRLLNESNDTKVLSVACHDLSQFIKFHPRGRFIVHSLNVRSRLMELMVAGDTEVRRYALNTVQVLMISNWSLMQKVE
jgi:V-type H+-transporting ATPase subunit H